MAGLSPSGLIVNIDYMSNGKLTLLGTGTCELRGLTASSVLVEFDDDHGRGGPDDRLVFDFGRGVCAQLAERGLRNDEVCHVVLSHFHPDHLSDLIPFLHAGRWSRRDPRTRDLYIYGPQGHKVQMMRLLGLFQGDDLFREKHFEHSRQRYLELNGEPYYEVRAQEVLEPTFSVGRRLFHYSHLPPFNNHGLKFSVKGKTFAFTGDSAFHEAEVEFLRGANFAVIDAGHLRDSEITRLAAATQVQTMICSHLYRDLDADALNSAASAAGYTGRLIIGYDGMNFGL